MTKPQTFNIDYSSQTHICTENNYMEFRKSRLHIIIMYNIFSSTTGQHNLKRNPTERRIQVYKKIKNILLYQTYDNRYIFLYEFFLGLVSLTDCMNIHMRVSLLMMFPVVTPLTSASLCTKIFVNLSTTMIQSITFPLPKRVGGMGDVEIDKETNNWYHRLKF